MWHDHHGQDFCVFFVSGLGRHRKKCPLTLLVFMFPFYYGRITLCARNYSYSGLVWWLSSLFQRFGGSNTIFFLFKFYLKKIESLCSLPRPHQNSNIACNMHLVVHIFPSDLKFIFTFTGIFRKDKCCIWNDINKISFQY